MIRSEEIKDFLSTRRASITPEQAGLPNYGVHRRVKGLRREEVAMLAGVSAEYYTKLERGNLAGASDSVLGSLASALKLSDDERSYLYMLARNQAGSKVIRRTVPPMTIRPNLQFIIDQMDVATYVRNTRMDILGSNPMARQLFPWLAEAEGRPVNMARYVFLDPDARTFFAEWPKAASDTVTMLRVQAARDPFDRAITELIGELSTLSPEFRQLWAKHNISRSQLGQKHYNHPVVGQLYLNYQILNVADDPNLIMLVYNAAPDSADVEKLQILKSRILATSAR
jgi:transcriptional regulator with XRE-family HTH domain